MTRLNGRGTLKLGNETFSVTKETARPRMGFRINSARIRVGWDWFAVPAWQLNGRELMLYRMRLRWHRQVFRRETITEERSRVT